MQHGIGSRELRAGDWVIYRVTKHTAHPGRHARSIQPARRGELYVYDVDKQWVVAEVREGGDLVVETRTGKRRLVSRADPALRRPTLIERWRLRRRFPRLSRPSAG
jgi:hypothetical protein